jgi:hypothetical protein
MRLCASVIAIAVLSPLSAFAQEPPPGAPPAAPAGAPPAAEGAPPAAPAAPPAAAAAPAAPAAPAKTWKDLVTFDGLVDAYYLFNFSGSGTNSSLIMPQYQRSFDVNSNTFTLSYAKLGIGMSADNVALRMDLGYGALANVVNGYPGPGVPLPMSTLTLSSPFLAEQAFLTLTPINNLTVDFGKFVTTAGAEVIEANKNWLYSRSLLFFNIPLVHTGVRVGYKVNDMLSLQGSVVNGWNGQGFEVAPNSMKTFGVNATITLPMGVGIIPTIYVGPTVPGGNTRFLGDLVASYTAGPLGLNLNFDYIHDTSTALNPTQIDPYIGVAVMGHYTVNDHVNVSARFEYQQQTPMSGASAQKNEEVTVGAAFPFAGHLELRPEIRADFGSPANFTESMAMGAALKSNQVTGTIAGLAYF